MKIDILTLFPEMFKGPFGESIIKRAQEKGFVEIKIHNLRDWAVDKYKSVDDKPYGGGAGMILRIDVVDAAITKLQTPNSKIILLDAGGKTFTQQKAKELSKEKHLILIAGHYEGVDHRVHEHLVGEVISIGDYVLTGGELPAMVIADAVVRLIPGAIEPASLKEESHSKKGYLEYPQYTRPEEYKSWKVPEVLLSGHHAEIKKWRKGKP
ncbi:MAG: tRNA (guanine-N(1)-)-methyltransferase, partial [Candidatus Woesebacteria bacterium GW2011_GWC1_43_10b]